MDYNEIEELLKKPKPNLELILTSYKETFEEVEHITELFRQSLVDSPDETDRLMKILGAIRASLNVVTTILDTEKINFESRFKHSERMKKENMAESVKATLLDIEASYLVSDIRRVRNRFEAYRDNCDKFIGICQNSLNNTTPEKYIKQ